MWDLVRLFLEIAALFSLVLEPLPSGEGVQCTSLLERVTVEMVES
jgi:hypothetical protein